MHVGELPGDIPPTSGRESTAEALVADAVDEEEIDSVIRVPSFKHLVKHAVSHLSLEETSLFCGVATEASGLSALRFGRAHVEIGFVNAGLQSRPWFPAFVLRYQPARMSKENCGSEYR